MIQSSFYTTHCFKTWLLENQNLYLTSVF